MRACCVQTRAQGVALSSRLVVRVSAARRCRVRAQREGTYSNRAADLVCSTLSMCCSSNNNMSRSGRCRHDTRGLVAVFRVRRRRRLQLCWQLIVFLALSARVRLYATAQQAHFASFAHVHGVRSIISITYVCEQVSQWRFQKYYQEEVW